MLKENQRAWTSVVLHYRTEILPVYPLGTFAYTNMAAFLEQLGFCSLRDSLLELILLPLTPDLYLHPQSPFDGLSVLKYKSWK